MAKKIRQTKLTYNILQGPLHATRIYKYFSILVDKLKCDPEMNPNVPLSHYTECCSVDQPCGLGQGDCDMDSECHGDLVCGRDNCGVKFNSTSADCCQIKGLRFEYKQN